MSDKIQNPDTHSSVKGLTYSRGWESLFFLSEAIMIVFYCVGTTYAEGGHSWDTDPVVIAA